MLYLKDLGSYKIMIIYRIFMDIQHKSYLSGYQNFTFYAWLHILVIFRRPYIYCKLFFIF